MVTVSLTPGALVDERYELLRLLGEGATGQVWLARDGERAIEVAVKLLRRRLASQEDVRARFQREAELSLRMLSPHIVKVLDGGLYEGRPYIVYERLEGQDLRSYLTANGALTLAEVKTLVVHICRALTRAHAIGVVHRDLKPDNVFRTTDPDGRLMFKLVDFGIAELTEHAPTEIVGTMQYLAPEVLMGEAPAAESNDRYALAAVAYECATGTAAFQAESMVQLMILHASETLEPPKLGDAVDEWFARALSRSPDVRFASAKEMATELDRATDVGERPSAMPPPMAFADAGHAELPSVIATPRTPVPEPAPPSEERISTRYSMVAPASERRVGSDAKP